MRPSSGHDKPEGVGEASTNQKSCDVPYTYTYALLTYLHPSDQVIEGLFFSGAGKPEGGGLPRVSAVGRCV